MHKYNTPPVAAQSSTNALLNAFQALTAVTRTLAPPLPPPMDELSIPDQVRVDWLLSQFGYMVTTLLERYAWRDCEVKALSDNVYEALRDARYALAWDSQQPSEFITQAEHDAIVAELHGRDEQNASPAAQRSEHQDGQGSLNIPAPRTLD